MNKHYIEKPKKPVCMQPLNLALVFLIAFVLFFLNPLLIIIFAVFVIIFYVYDIYRFKHMPEAILYAKNSVLYYYKKAKTGIDFNDIIEVKLNSNKKKARYITIKYKEDNLEKDLVIKSDNAEALVEELQKDVKKTKNRILKKEEQIKKSKNK